MQDQNGRNQRSKQYKIIFNNKTIPNISTIVLDPVTRENHTLHKPPKTNIPFNMGDFFREVYYNYAGSKWTKSKK